MKQKRYDVVTVGEILTEILSEKINQDFKNPGGTLLGGFPSGAPAIAIDQCARMGAKTTIIAKIGSDDFGTMNKNRLSNDNVDTSNIIVTEENVTGTAFVSYKDDGSRKFIFHFATAACGELKPDDINEEIIASSRILHIMGCSITGSPSMFKAIEKALNIAKENNILISFDPNIRPELYHGAIKELFKDILFSCDILLTGESELQQLCSNPAASMIEMFQKNSKKIIIIKNGSKKTKLYTGDTSLSIKAFPSIEVDATGAGDCFDGTFLALICQGHSLRKALTYANAAGALAVSKRGPMEGNCNYDSLEELINDNPSIRPIDITRFF